MWAMSFIHFLWSQTLNEITHNGRLQSMDENGGKATSMIGIAFDQISVDTV